MSKQQNMTPEQHEAWKAKRRESPEYKANRQRRDDKYIAWYLAKKRAQPEYQAKKRESERNATPNAECYTARARVSSKKRKQATRQQAAADQFFIMAGAAQSISEAINNKQKPA